MRSIEVDLDVFSEIWSRRLLGEDSENEILRRLLVSASSSESFSVGKRRGGQEANKFKSKEGFSSNQEVAKMHLSMKSGLGKIRWVDDVRAALVSLGGEASLNEIYKTVRRLRAEGGRSVPSSLAATIRRTIEDHSSDSENFRGNDYFQKVERGVWGLRQK